MFHEVVFLDLLYITIFSLFINDVSNTFEEFKVKLKLFADDIKLYSIYDVHGSQSDLVTAVNRLYEWSCMYPCDMPPMPGGGLPRLLMNND